MLLKFVTNLLQLLNIVMEVFCIDISITNYDLESCVLKVLGDDCFSIYRNDFVAIIEHILTTYRLLLGRPKTIEIIQILWDNIPSEDNDYIQEYRRIMVETVGLKPLIC